MKMNTYSKETLSDGVSLGPAASDMVGPHNPAKLIHTDMLRSEFIFDVLNGCAFNCVGCYIPRRNTCTPDDIESAISIANTLQEMSVTCEEMFIGPTDIFTATNFDDIMDNPRMYELTANFSISASSTLMCDTRTLKMRWHTLQKHLNNAAARDFELFVAFDLHRYINNDREYIDRLTKHLQLFVRDTVVFVVNYHEGMFNSTSLYVVAKQIHDEFNVQLRLIPSFFRLKNTERIERQVSAFKTLLVAQLPDDEPLPDYINFNMFDKYFGGDGFVNLSYKDGELYVTPYLFDGIPQTDDVFKIDRPHNAENITNKMTQLVTSQYSYATQTAGCSYCSLLPSCVGRKVLAYMESRGLIDCIIPKDNIWDRRDYV